MRERFRSIRSDKRSFLKGNRHTEIRTDKSDHTTINLTGLHSKLPFRTGRSRLLRPEAAFLEFSLSVAPVTKPSTWSLCSWTPLGASGPPIETLPRTPRLSFWLRNYVCLNEILKIWNVVFKRYPMAEVSSTSVERFKFKMIDFKFI